MDRNNRRRVSPVTLLAIIVLVTAVALSGCGAQGAAPSTMATGEPAPTEPASTAAPPTEAPPTEAAPMEAPTATPESTATTAPPTATPAPTETPAMVAPSVDGAVMEGEYQQQADFGDIRLWWHNDDTHLYMAMAGDTAGWVAVGINPRVGMQGADYLFGYVQDGETMIWDAYGTEPTGANHPPDEDLGGTDDIVAFAGVEADGVTTIEVQRPLETGDTYDQRLEPGQSYPIIVAIGGEDAFNAYHLRYDRGDLALMAP